MQKNLLLLLFAVMSIAYSMAETSLCIEYFDGAELTTALSVVGRWEFNDGKFILVSTEGEVLAEKASVYDVKKVVFKADFGPNVDVDKAVAQLIVYPNPTQDVLFVDGLTVGEEVRVYLIDGQLLMSEVASQNGSVQFNVESLVAGTYILQMETEIVKIIKK